MLCYDIYHRSIAFANKHSTAFAVIVNYLSEITPNVAFPLLILEQQVADFHTSMALLYAAVARGHVILAKYETCSGNFHEVTEQILQKIPDTDSKMTYSHGSYLYHYVRENGITYYAITEDDYERSKAFRFLGEIKRKFQSFSSSQSSTALPYSLNTGFSEVLAASIHKFSKEDFNETKSKTDEVQSQLDELKGIMVKNIDNIAQRGENLNLLVDKTEDLSQSTVTFRTTSTNLARKLWWKNVKITVILVIVAIIVIYIIVSSACGGPSWPHCVGHHNSTG